MGGCRHDGNLVLACKTCNARRGGGLDTPIWPPDVVVEHLRACPEVTNERARRWYGGSSRTVADLSLVPARDRQ